MGINSRVFKSSIGFMTSPLSKLGLSTAQLALDQPQTAARSRPRDVEAREILQIGERSGLPVLELSGHSAHAETVLSSILPRPNPFRVTIYTARPDRGPDFVEAELRAQLRRLGLDQVHAILAPMASDLFGPNGQIGRASCRERV